MLLLALVAGGAVSCQGRVPDVGGFAPVLQEDGRIVELLQEADTLSERDAPAAARNLREVVLPRARANAAAAARVAPEHPRARALARDLVRASEERAATIELYANALVAHDDAALLGALRRQRALEQSMDQLESEVQSASRAPPDRGCSASR